MGRASTDKNGVNMEKMLAAALVAAVHATAVAQGGELTASAGVDYTRGDYGLDEKTQITAFLLAGKYETGRWTYRASLPYLRISGPSSVVGSGEGGVTLPGQGGPRRSASGFGDLVLAASFLALHDRAGPFFLDVGAKVKLGTGDEAKGLGTGEEDLSLQAEAFKPYGGLTPFALLGYRWYGDPEGIDLNNVVYGSLGAAYRVSAATSAGAAYDFRGRIVDGGARVSELVAFVSRSLSADLKLQFYVLKGFADASPDHGVGAVLSHTY